MGVINSFWSVTVFLVCVLVLVAAALMFWVLDQRWTMQRAWTRLSDWARPRGWRFYRTHPPALPDALGAMQAGGQVVCALVNGAARLLQVRTQGVASASERNWNLLVCRLQEDWPMTGLYPDEGDSGVAGLYPLDILAGLSNAGRFTVVGTDRRAARALCETDVRGLLPSDMSLLIVAHELVLDFSAYPFDPISFDRMLSIAGQIAGELRAIDITR